jgi:hypothetical protein
LIEKPARILPTVKARIACTVAVAYTLLSLVMQDLNAVRQPDGVTNDQQ